MHCYKLTRSQSQDLVYRVLKHGGKTSMLNQCHSIKSLKISLSSPDFVTHFCRKVRTKSGVERVSWMLVIKTAHEAYTQDAHKQ